MEELAVKEAVGGKNIRSLRNDSTAKPRNEKGITKKRGAITGGSITGKRGDLSLSSLLPQNVRNQSNLFDSISKPHGSLNWRGVASASKQVRYHNAYNRKSLW